MKRKTFRMQMDSEGQKRIKKGKHQKSSSLFKSFMRLLLTLT
jgi:hypothetical protein